MMATQEHCTVEQLAEVFRQVQEEIIIEWRLQARKLLRELNLNKPTITDHLPAIIAEIIRDLALGREGTLSEEHVRGSPPVHGVQRFHDGLDLGEVVTEYNLLRVAFNTVAERHNLYVVGDASRIINHRIDEAVRMAVMAFAAQQALIRKERNSEHLAFIAHDLRTPLNGISLLVAELKDGMESNSPAEVGELFGSLHRNLRRVEELIKRVMDTNVQTSGSSFNPERRTFELWPLSACHQMVNLGHPFAGEAGDEHVFEDPVLGLVESCRACPVHRSLANHPFDGRMLLELDADEDHPKEQQHRGRAAEHFAQQLHDVHLMLRCGQ